MGCIWTPALMITLLYHTLLVDRIEPPLLVRIPARACRDLELIPRSQIPIGKIDALIMILPLNGKVRVKDPLLLRVPI